MKTLLILLLTIVSIESSWSKEEIQSSLTTHITLKNFESCCCDKSGKSDWVTTHDDFDIRYHFRIKLDRHRYAFKFEVRGKNNTPLDFVDSDGNVAVIQSVPREDPSKRKEVDTTFFYFKRRNNSTSDWFFIPDLSTREITDPSKGWYDSKTDSVKAIHRFNFVSWTGKKIDKEAKTEISEYKI